MFLAGDKYLLSITVCKGLLVQIWDFSIYPQEKAEEEKARRGKNPALAEKILKDVLRVYEHTSGG